MELSNFFGKKIAIMVSNGFEEKGFIAIQRALLSAGSELKVVSRENGLINAWSGEGWGMSYAADAKLSTTLAIDYTALIIPAGSRHIESLKKDAHAKRVLRAFLREDMPILLQGEAVAMIENIDDNIERIRAGSNDISPVVDRNLVTISKATENLQELESLNAVMGVGKSESYAA